jgi:hypothetical protein
MKEKITRQKSSLSVQVRICWTMLADALRAQPAATAAIHQLKFSPQLGAVSAELPSSVLIGPHVSVLDRAWNWLKDRAKAEPRTRKLRVCESTQLGEKKFVALIQADGHRFLIGGTNASITLLATLPQSEDFQSVLQQSASFTVHE